MAGTHAGRVEPSLPVALARARRGPRRRHPVRLQRARLAGRGPAHRPGPAARPHPRPEPHQRGRAPAQLDELQAQVDEATAAPGPGRPARPRSSSARPTSSPRRPGAPPVRGPAVRVHPRRREARGRRGARRRRPRRLRHPPAGRAGGRQRAVGGRRRGDDAPGPAGHLDQRRALRRQHPHPPGPRLLPALRHHRDRRHRDAMRAALDTGRRRREPARVVGRRRPRLRRAATPASRPSPPTAARSSRSTPRSPRREARAASSAGPASCSSRSGCCCSSSPPGSCGGPTSSPNRAQARIVADPRGRVRPQARPAPVRGNGIPAAIGEDGAFAVVRIPRFGADYARPVIEGTDRAGAGPRRRPLRRHRRARGRSATSPSPGTAPPTGDRSTTSTGSRTATGWSSRPPARCYVYEVTSREIVRPSDVEVIAPVPDEPGAHPDRGAAHDDVVPPEVQRHRALRRARPARGDGAARAVGPVRAGSPPRRRADPCMPRCGAHLPGPAWVRALLCLVLALVVVAVCFRGCSRRSARCCRSRTSPSARDADGAPLTP